MLPMFDLQAFPCHAPGQGWEVGVGAPLWPGDLPDLGIEPGSIALQADSLPSELPGKPSTLHSFHQILWPEIHPTLPFYSTERPAGLWSPQRNPHWEIAILSTQ